MSEPFFSREDCDVIHCGDWAISIPKANRLLRERAQVVRGSMREDGTHRYFGADPFPVMPNTHTALLICVEPIAKDSAEKIVEDLVKWAERSQLSASLGGCPKDIYDRARKLKGGV